MATPEIVLLGAGEGWHTLRLERAFKEAGAEPVRIPYAACSLVPEPPGVRLGRRERLPAAVLVRAIPAGSFEQVTLRLGVLHALERLGVPVLNPAPTVERCVDKSATAFLLGRAGIATPPTWTVETAAAASAIVTAEAAAGHRTVVKPLFGNQGKGLRLIAGPAELPVPEAVAGVWHLQRYVGRESGWHDHRVLVVAGRAVAAMTRHGTGWITNIRQGARPEPAPVTGRLAELAVAAAEALAAFYAGVDLIEGEAGPVVLEVNSMPAWQGLQSVSEADIAAALAAAVMARLAA